MEKKLYSIYDKQLERFNVPGFEDDDHIIMVSLQRAAKDKSSFLYINAEDLDLYCLGIFDDKTGYVVKEDQPRLVCHLSSIIIKGE